MSKRTREPFGKAGLTVAILALVVALAGGAVAAENSGDATASAKKNNRKGKQGGLNAKQKRQVRIIATALAKRFQGTGPAGPQGVPGLPGAPGADGDDGSDGSDGASGTNGADGNSVLNGVGVPDDALGVDGDFYVDTSSQEIYGPKAGGSWPLPGTALKGTDGEDGEPWVAGQAPSGAILKGTWSVHANAVEKEETIRVNISTGVPVQGSNAIIGNIIPPGGPDPWSDFGSDCTGTAAAPTPATIPNFVCIYSEVLTNLSSLEFPGGEVGRVNTSGGGLVVDAKATEAGVVDAYGTWVMIAP